MAAERSPSVARADGARRSVAVPNGEGVAAGGATTQLKIPPCILLFSYMVAIVKVLFCYL